jgi:hypothetical protein
MHAYVCVCVGMSKYMRMCVCMYVCVQVVCIVRKYIYTRSDDLKICCVCMHAILFVWMYVCVCMYECMYMSALSAMLIQPCAHVLFVR